MLIILLLAFLQSLAQREGWGPGDASSRSRRWATPVAGALAGGIWAAKKAIPITLCLLMGFTSHVCCSECGTPLQLMLRLPGMLEAEVN